MVTLTVEGTTVTVYETGPIRKVDAQRFLTEFIPDGSKLYVKRIGSEGLRVGLDGLLKGANYLTDKNQLQTWHDAAIAVTYNDTLESLSMVVTGLRYELVPGWVQTLRVSLVLNEA